MKKVIDAAIAAGLTPKELVKVAESVADEFKLNPTPHLNRQRVKQTALEIAIVIRPANKFARVGLSFLERIEAKTRAAIREEVRIHPSKGKTLL